MPLDGKTYEAPNVYDRCADIIEQRGHCKNRLGLPTGEVCLMGAFELDRGRLLPTGSMHPYDINLEDRTEFARGMGFVFRCEAVLWNNAPERTKEEVVARLREAAKAQREALIDAI